jgi:hypothetical protein
MKIDNFALTMFQTCPAKYFLRMHEGWTARRRTGALGFGTVLHEGLATWYRTGDLGKALLSINEKWPDNMPVDDFRTKEKCLRVMMEYAKKYPTEAWTILGAPENPVIEVPFTLDTGMFLPCQECWIIEDKQDVITDGMCSNCAQPLEPIEYGGIYDMLVEFGGSVFVVDHKSTSVMGSGYFNQFKPNNQMTGYIWGGSLMSGKRVSGAIINAIGVYKTGATKFDREITSRSPAAIEEWLRNLWHECVNIKQAERTGFFPLRTGACTQYGLCEYHSVHSLDNEKERQRRLETDYVREQWDYENRDV